MTTPHDPTAGGGEGVDLRQLQGKALASRIERLKRELPDGFVVDDLGVVLHLDGTKAVEKIELLNGNAWDGTEFDKNGFAVRTPAERAWAKLWEEVEPQAPPADETHDETNEEEVPGADEIKAKPPANSEDALALDFAKRGVETFRWSPGLGWMFYDGVKWAPDKRLKRFSLARRICRWAAVGARGNEKKRIASAKTNQALLSLAQSDFRIVASEKVWDADPMLLNTPAGIIDLRTGKLRPRTAADCVTQVTSVSPDFEKVPTRFLQFLDEIFKGATDELIPFMRRLLGYLLTGERRERMLIFAFGARAKNGKNTLFDLVLWLLNDYAIKLPPAALMTSKNEQHPTGIAQLRAKRFALSSELAEGEHLNESLIKELTGDPVVRARLMRQDFFEFTVTHKHVILGNYKPRVHGGDTGVADRVVLIPFNNRFVGDKDDKFLAEKLRAEGPAILAWMIAGSVSWAADGMKVPEEVRAASEEYMEEHNDMEQWIADRCERGSNPDDYQQKAMQLYINFSIWKQNRGEKPCAATTWFGRLQLLDGVAKKRTEKGIVYTGIRLKSAPSIEPSPPMSRPTHEEHDDVPF